MHDHDQKDPTKPGLRQQPAQPDHLLDELTSIRALLDSERAGATTDVPMLDDVVGFAASFKAVDAEPAPALLDLDGIFGDGPGGEDAGNFEPASAHLTFPKFTLDVALTDEPDAATAPVDDNERANYRREALIQELVAEFLPRIEATLRERLAGLDDQSLHALKKPD